MRQVRRVLPILFCAAAASVLLSACSAPSVSNATPKPEPGSAVVAAGESRLDGEPDCGLAVAGSGPVEGCSESALTASAEGAAKSAFGFEEVHEKARRLAEQAYVEPSPLPKSAAELDYDQYRRIQNNLAAKTWASADTAFRVLFDPRGYLFTHSVVVHLIENGAVQSRAYSADDFDFKDLPLADEVKESLGFAGFRVLTVLNEAGKFDEVVSFKGASFFRALGAGTVYGASARGLSIGTASPDGEEFPNFSEFWLVRPTDASPDMTIYALMDGKSVTGAFEFRIAAGPETRTDVSATFFPRRELTSVGVAPLSSMYFFSPHDIRKQADDFRPAVHDSEGLNIQLANGEWVWRPLVNPQSLQISVLATEAPRGFGLIQRKRDLEDYADVEAEYHRRPNVWIEPTSNWGGGQLSLIEIPTANEYNDNIVVFWKPAQAWQPGRSYDVSYNMRWSLSPPEGIAVIPVAETRSGKIADRRRQLFVIDFQSADEALTSGVEASISTSAGTIENPIIKRNSETGKTRLTFELAPDNAPVVELRALLTRGGSPVSETWLYRWRAE